MSSPGKKKADYKNRHYNSFLSLYMELTPATETLALANTYVRQV